jgi:hypothetical protein
MVRDRYLIPRASAAKSAVAAISSGPTPVTNDPDWPTIPVVLFVNAVVTVFIDYLLLRDV